MTIQEEEEIIGQISWIFNPIVKWGQLTKSVIKPWKPASQPLSSQEAVKLLHLLL